MRTTRPCLGSVLLALVVGLVAVTAQAASSRIIHNWTIRTPLGEFGWLEIGGDEFPAERYFLFGQLGYLPTRASASVVVIGASAVVVTLGTVGFLLLKLRYARRD
ncbi:MAG: hypothetical protein GX456_15740 [Verrucomicrobia bacterium]|nr:hypothetical protein [Verrucomicrobiota bacterium]